MLCHVLATQQNESLTTSNTIVLRIQRQQKAPEIDLELRTTAASKTTASYTAVVRRRLHAIHEGL